MIIMSSIVEAIARQAQITFSRSVSEEGFSDGLSLLTRIVKRVRASDLRVSRDMVRGPAPVVYVEVIENKTFSMGVFLLRPGARIPLHDHPGMHGVLKMLFGTVSITSYSPLEAGEGPPPAPGARPVQRLAAAAPMGERDEPCVLSPRDANFHEISAGAAPAAFLDILAPPYDARKERDCHYYKPLQDSRQRTWLVRTPSPPDFWCESADYTGPPVNPS